MTGLICLTKTFALAALAACGLLMAGGQLETGGPAKVSLETGTTAQAEPGGGIAASNDVSADVAISSEPISDQTPCADNCPAPCATACADLQRPPFDGAVEVGASFDAAVAPEHLCGCQPEVPAALDPEAEIEIEAESTTVELGAAAGAGVGDGPGGY